MSRDFVWRFSAFSIRVIRRADRPAQNGSWLQAWENPLQSTSAGVILAMLIVAKEQDSELDTT